MKRGRGTRRETDREARRCYPRSRVRRAREELPPEPRPTPDLVFGGLERLEFESDRIRYFTDIVNEGDDVRIEAYLAEHFPDG